MSMLHMDQEACRELLSSLDSTHVYIKDTLQGMTNVTNNLVGRTWISASAQEFLNQFSELGHGLDIQADTLETLTRQLRLEINKWSSADARFGR